MPDTNVNFLTAAAASPCPISPEDETHKQTTKTSTRFFQNLCLKNNFTDATGWAFCCKIVCAKIHFLAIFSLNFKDLIALTGAM